MLWTTVKARLARSRWADMLCVSYLDQISIFLLAIPLVPSARHTKNFFEPLLYQYLKAWRIISKLKSISFILCSSKFFETADTQDVGRVLISILYGHDEKIVWKTFSIIQEDSQLFRILDWITHLRRKFDGYVPAYLKFVWIFKYFQENGDISITIWKQWHSSKDWIK